MTHILTTYLAREILKTSCATLLVLFVILVSNSLGRILAGIADGDIPQQALWPVLFSESVYMLSLLLPITFFLGIIFTFGRMYKDHEIVVMQACGVGYRDFYRPVLLALIPFMIASIYSSLWLNAQVLSAAASAIEQGENLNEFQLVKPGQFNQDKGGKLVVFMESLSEDKLELREIIINQPGSGEMVIETARTGRQKIDDKSGDLFLVIGPGDRYVGEAGSKKVEHISFEQHGILIEKRARAARLETPIDAMQLSKLWRSKKLRHRVEFQWRIMVPVVLLVLALLAVPLAYIAPRQGRYGKVGVALLVFIVYLNLLAFTRSQLEDRVIPIALNFWWVHLIFLTLTVVLIYRRNGGQLRRQVTT